MLEPMIALKGVRALDRGAPQAVLDVAGLETTVACPAFVSWRAHRKARAAERI
jgi:hypothetical protein